MRFQAVCKDGIILTDDYSNEEIEENLHIKNLKEDCKNCFPEGSVITVLDSQDNIIRHCLVDLL